MTDEFNEVKKSIDLALEEIKKASPELYNHLKKTIIMDANTKRFGYFPSKEQMDVHTELAERINLTADAIIVLDERLSHIENHLAI